MASGPSWWRRCSPTWAMQPPNSGLRQATLEALGYVCEEMGRIDQDVLEQEQINSILTAVVQGMRKDEPDSGVRLAATVALLNALEFAQTNFENADERNYLMQVMPRRHACCPEHPVSPQPERAWTLAEGHQRAAGHSARVR